MRERSQSHNNYNSKLKSGDNSRNRKLHNVNSIYDKKIGATDKKTASTIDNALEKNVKEDVSKENSKTLP